MEEVDIEGNTPLHVAVEAGVAEADAKSSLAFQPSLEAPRNEIATVSCLLEHMVSSLSSCQLHSFTWCDARRIRIR